MAACGQLKSASEKKSKAQLKREELAAAAAGAEAHHTSTGLT
jgi:23S rRNA (adenine2503-C2)-methyltransferase